MSSKADAMLKSVICCSVIILTAVLAGPAQAETPLSRYESGDRVFEKFESGDLLVYYHLRKIDQATVEKDFIVYHFDGATEELLAVKSHWREDLPEHLPAGLLSREAAEDLAGGEVLRSSLYVISPESDVFPLDPTPENPCWVVRHLIEGGLAVTVIDAVAGVVLGNGVPPPYEGFSLSGPWEFNPCYGTWSTWRENAKDWFETMGYATESVSWPTEDKVRSHIQSCQTAMFYELAHGDHHVFQSGCVGGTTPEATLASEIESWIAGYAKMPFAFIGSCGGMCWKIDGSFAYEFRKGEPESASVVGYCNMAESWCDNCWTQSIDWQNALFDYMNQGWTVRDAFSQANADVPACGDSSCMRFAGDQDFAVVPVVSRDPWPPLVTVIDPDGGETLEYGTIYEIAWEATDNAVIDSVAVLLSLDSGITFPHTIATGEVNDGSYLWNVPDIDSKTARIKIVATDCATNEGIDSSDSDFTLWGTTSGVEKPDMAGTPAAISLDVTGGNPVKGGTRLVFGLPYSANVRLAVYDVTGRCLSDLMHGYLPEGYHAVRWNCRAQDGSRLRPGLYFIRLDSDAGGRSAKVVVAG
jgi:hypothetical protein